ncbi:unnamed protein product [Victoria cruziana]
MLKRNCKTALGDIILENVSGEVNIIGKDVVEHPVESRGANEVRLERRRGGLRKDKPSLWLGGGWAGARCRVQKRLRTTRPIHLTRSLSLEKLDLSNATSVRECRIPTCTDKEEVGHEPDGRRLKDLCLSGSKIQKLPVSISSQKNLRILHLDDCKQLEEVPKWIEDLYLLDELSLSNCPLITGLPDTIGSLKNLRRLNLSGCCEVRALPDSIGDLESLAQLLLQNTSLKELPKKVGRLRKLEILDLGSCKQLQRLPSSIGELENLSELVLDGTDIEELPSSIAALPNLELLWLRGCSRLGDLPTGLREDLLLIRDNPL